MVVWWFGVSIYTRYGHLTFYDRPYRLTPLRPVPQGKMESHTVS